MKLSAALFFSALASASAFLATPTNFAFNIASAIQSSSSLSVAAETRPLGIPGTAELDKPWKELGFEFRPTKSNLRVTYKNGEWGEPELCEVSTVLP